MHSTPGRKAPFPGLPRTLDRRSFLGIGLTAAAGAALLPQAASAAVLPPERYLHLHVRQTGESFRGPYWADGKYIPEALADIDHLLRDFHVDEMTVIDTRLLNLLEVLRREIDYRKPFEVVSAYRTATTNAELRKSDHRVAKNSFHVKGMAVDIGLRGRDLRQFYKAARSLRAGGVGYYPKSSFVHLDVGTVRFW